MGPEGKLLEKEPVVGLRTVVIPDLVRQINPLRDILAYFALKKHFEQEKYDVVHTHSSKAGILARVAAWRAGVPVVVHTIHGLAFHPFEHIMKNFIYITCEKIVAKYCHKIYAVSQAMIDQCVAQNIARPEKFKVVYSGVDLQPFIDAKPDVALAKSLGIGVDSFVIGTVARLFELKGYDILMKVAPLIIKEVPYVKFLIIGDGNLSEWIHQEVDRLGMVSNFIFCGLIAPEKIPQHICLMNMLIHLSLREGLPRAITQAHCCGKPAVAFNLDGTPEVLLDRKTGFLTEPHDIDAIVKACVTIAGDKDLTKQMGESAREHVQKLWGWQRMVGILESEYQELLEPTE